MRRRSSCGMRGRSAAAGSRSLLVVARDVRRAPLRRRSALPLCRDGGDLARAATQHLLVYLATALGHVALIVVASVSFAFGCVRASRSLHRNVVAKLMHAPLSWYDSTPSGRTMSRFTTDVSQVDLQLSLELDNTFQMSSSLLMLCGPRRRRRPPADDRARAGDPRDVGRAPPRYRPQQPRGEAALEQCRLPRALERVRDQARRADRARDGLRPLLRTPRGGGDRAVGVPRLLPTRAADVGSARLVAPLVPAVRHVLGLPGGDA